MKECYLFIALFFYALTLPGQFTDISQEAPFYITSMDNYLGTGVSFYDVDHDGLDDITLCSAGSDIRIYLNQGGFYNDYFAIENLQDAKCPLWADFDNDGDSDFLYTIRGGSVRLFRNDGDLSFTEVTTDLNLPFTNAPSYGASWGDYDRDGFLDLYVCNYNDGSLGTMRNWLFHNNTDGTFTEQAIALGVDNGLKFSFQSTWVDFDQDGWLDLYVVNDRHDGNALYHNTEGTFVNISSTSGTGIQMDAMCNSISDFDNDGDFDIFCTNIPAEGNKMLKNNGNLLFTDATNYSGLAVNSNCWSGLWIDHDLDGSDDIQICDGDAFNTSDPNSFFVNDGTGHFVALSGGGAVPGDDGYSYCSAKGDLNNDGRWDYVVVNDFPEGVDLFENSTTTNHGIKICLQGTLGNADGIGSIIKVYSQGKFYMTQTMSGENFMSQDSQYEIVGLGTNTNVDSLIVQWPGGWIDRWYNIGADQFVMLEEGSTFTVEIATSSNYVNCSDTPVVLSAGNYASYLWSNNSQDQSIQITEAGWYWFQGTNEFGLSATDSVFIQIYDAPNVLSEVFNASCPGFNDGAIYLALEESEIENVFWNSPFLQGSSPTGLSQGNYEYEIVDQNGCSSFGEIEIIEPAPFSIGPYSLTACFGESISFVPDITGGTGPIDSDWGSVDPLELYAGEYSFTVTDELGCDSIFQIDVTQWEEIITEMNLTNSYDGANGTCELTIEGGSGDFEFLWSNGDDSNFADSLAQGNYTAIISDGHGCTREISFSIIDMGINDVPKTSGISPTLIDDHFVVNNYIGVIHVFSLAGQLICSHKVTSNAFIINVASWSSGIYVLQCGIENHQVVKK
jgi:hypothetical protein